MKTDEVGEAYTIRSAMSDTSMVDAGRRGTIRDDSIYIGRARLISRPLATIAKQIHHARIIA